ncbi:MAG: glycoside hydrolase family 1 protein [Elusimicrobiota bacterium]
MPIITFPENFIWGAASASYQTEGGNGASALAGDWEKRKGWEPCGAACGSWDRFDEDLRCLEALGANAYRFSLEWSRLEPRPGVFDDEALRRYEDWIRRLRAAAIEPVVTLHHFSEPAWLLREHPRGWLDAGVRERWLDLVGRVGAALSSSVRWWTTINEPMVFAISAYGAGAFPPGRRMLLGSLREFNEVLVPALARAHREAYALIKKRRPDAMVSLAHHVGELLPARPGDEGAVDRWDWFFHRHFLDLTKEALDYVGLNYYTRAFVATPRVPFFPMSALPGYAEFERELGPWAFRLLGGVRGPLPRTDMGWEIAPESFGRVVSRLWKDYGKPILVTENGIADAGGAGREAYLREHLSSLRGAMDGGARVLGYLHWSLTDNWEWGSYRPRFGLFDRDRRPAGGADFYARVCRTGRLA